MQVSLNTNLHESQIRIWHGTEKMIHGNLGSHNGINEDSSLLGFYPLPVGSYLPLDLG